MELKDPLKGKIDYTLPGGDVEEVDATPKTQPAGRMEVLTAASRIPNALKAPVEGVTAPQEPSKVVEPQAPVQAAVEASVTPEVTSSPMVTTVEPIIPPAPLETGKDYSIGSDLFFQTIKNDLGISENAGRYNTNPNIAGAMGKYQFIPARLQELGYGWVNPANFTPQLQEEVMTKHLQDLVNYGVSKGYINESTTPDQAAGLIWAGHLGGYGGMNNSAKGRKGASDAFGTSTGFYYNKGSQKFRFAQAGGIVKDIQLGNNASGTAVMYRNSGDLAPTTSHSEMFSRALNSTYASQTISGIHETRDQIRNDLINKMSKETGLDIQSMLKKEIANIQAETQYDKKSPFLKEDHTSQAFDSVLSTIKATNPDYKLPVTSDSEVAQLAGKSLNKLIDAYNASSESASFSQSIAGAVGGMIGYMKDPYNIAAMISGAGWGGAGGYAAKQIIARGATQAISETPIQSGVQTQRESVGLSHGIGEGATNLAMVGLGSIGIETIGVGLARGVKALINKGGDGLKELGKRLQTSESGAPMQTRAADMIGRQLEDAGDILNQAPMAHTAQGRAHLEDSLDIADKLAHQDKPIDIYPVDAPTFGKPFSQETHALTERLLAELSPEEQAAHRADIDEWNDWRAKAISGTEEEAAKTPIAPQKLKTLNEAAAEKVNLESDRTSKVVDSPEFSKKIEQEFDQLAEEALPPKLPEVTEQPIPTAPRIEHIAYEKYKLTTEKETKSKAIQRDQESLDNWDQIRDNPDLPEYKKNDVAREHISKRIYENKARLSEIDNELGALEKGRAETPERFVEIEDAAGNITERPVSEVMQEVQNERTSWKEFADCIKRGGTSPTGE